MANPGTAAIANANANITAGTSSLRSFITTPSEDFAPHHFRSSRSFPSPEERSDLSPDRTGDSIRSRVRIPLFKLLAALLVAQLELEGHRRDHIHRLVIHPHRFAAPL